MKQAQVAPGLPSMENLGSAEELQPGLAPWVIQRHLAQRAGPHYDVRIGNPYGMLMSWAARHLPEPGEKRLAIQQPLHEGQYADFEGELKSRYGRGTVKKHDRGEVLITEVSPRKINFVVAHKKQPQHFTLVKTRLGSKSWLMINTTPQEVIENKKVHYTKVPAKDVEKLFNEDYLASAKIDGAAALVKLMGDKIEVLSYRTTKEGKPIHHTLRMAGKPIKAKIPKELQGKVLRGELYGTREGKAIPVQELGGILNSALAKAIRQRKETGTDLRVALYGILGEELAPYGQTQEKLKAIMKHLPKEYFEVEEPKSGAQALRELWEEVTSGRHPRTQEGLVFRHKKGGKPIKVVPRPESDVYVREVKEGPKGGALFTYSLTPGGPVVGKVGQGFTAATRKAMLADPSGWIGRRARIESKEQFPSGAHRAPSFIALHEDYPAVEDDEEEKLPKLGQALIPDAPLRAAGRSPLGTGVKQTGKGIGTALDESPVLSGIGMGAGAGMAAGALYVLLKRMTDKKRRKRSALKDYLITMLLGGATGGTAGGLTGLAYREWLDPAKMAPETKKALRMPKRLSRTDWRRLYLENVKDPEAKAYFLAHEQDPSHPVNQMYQALTEHADKPDIDIEPWATLPRSAQPAGTLRGPDEPYKGQETSGFTYQDLRDLGFVESAIAVPEAGQRDWMTWRHPEHNVHFHRHPKRWFMHVDAYPSTQVLQRRLQERGINPYSAKNLARASVYGLPHALGEGVPGWMRASAAWAFDRPGLGRVRDIQEGIDPDKAGRSYARPGVIAKRLGLVGGIPAATYLGYLGLSSLMDDEEEEDRPKSRSRKLRPRLTPSAAVS